MAKLESVRKQDDPIAWLSDQIKVDFARGSEILKISMTAACSPQDLEILVNLVTDSYMGEIVEQERLERVAQLERLRSLFDSMQKEMPRNDKSTSNLSYRWAQEQQAKRRRQTAIVNRTFGSGETRTRSSQDRSPNRPGSSENPQVERGQ